MQIPIIGRSRSNSGMKAASLYARLEVKIRKDLEQAIWISHSSAMLRKERNGYSVTTYHTA